ncbi:MAG: M48 family metallopeptidase [Chloroflexota bacterium]
MAATPQIDPDRQARAKEYAARQRLLYLVSLGLSSLFVGLALLVNPGRWFSAALPAASPYLAVVAYFAALLLVYELIGLPLGYYQGLILPRRYGLSRQTAGGWLRDQLKSTALVLVFGAAVVLLVYWLLVVAPTTWWLWAALALLLFTVVLANLSPILLVPLFYKLRPLADEELAARLRRLAESAGARVGGVFVMDLSSRTTAANAALMGLGNTRRIVLGDTLLDRYTADEIETVLAHELGHHVHGDIVKGIVVQTTITLLSFWLADWALRWGADRLGFNALSDPAGLPLLGLVFGLVGLLAMPLTNAFTRWMENEADQYALERTGKPEAFIAAMTRLANQNLADIDPPRWVEVLLYDHPAIGRRLARAEGYWRQRGEEG